MANRERKNQMKFYVTEDERALIYEKMKVAGGNNMGAYLRKMAVDGMIFKIDNEPMRNTSVNISRIASSINQIAKVTNTNGHAYREDIDDLKRMLKQIWQLQKSIISKLP